MEKDPHPTSSDLQEVSAPEGQIPWTESKADGSISEANYLKRIQFWAGNIGHALDVVKRDLATEEDNERWIELKQRVSDVKSGTDPYDLTGLHELEKDALSFIEHLGGIDQSEYEKVANKY